MELENINTYLANSVSNLLRAFNIDYYNSSPGLRNAPLLNAIKNNQHILMTSNFDERAAGYRALAQSKTSGKPSVLFCTSGTALANYLPAIIEAYYQELPIIIISSDRPKQNIDVLSNQSIMQNNIFSQYIDNFHYIEAPTPDIDPKKFKNDLVNFLKNATELKMPSHLNISFWDPANIKENQIKGDKLDQWKKILNETKNYTSDDIKNRENNLNYNYNGLEKPDLISIGEMNTCQDSSIIEAITKFITQSNIPFTLDITSGLKYKFTDKPNYIPSFDHPEIYQRLNSEEIKCVWHIGKRMTSKHYYRFLNSKNIKLTTFTNSKHNFNPGFCENNKLPLNASLISDLRKIVSQEIIKPKLNFSETIKTKQEIINNGELSFPYISKRIIEENKESNQYFVLGNSTAIRSFDYFASEDPQNNPIIYTHRGASGIEGFIAAIKGIDDIAPKGITINAIIGDITFMHDFNSIFLFKDINRPINVFLVNDFGGGIFKLLNVEELNNTKDEMVTPHSFEFNEILSPLKKVMPSLEVVRIESKIEFDQCLIKANQSHQENKLTINEIILNETNNLKVYQCLRTIKK